MNINRAARPLDRTVRCGVAVVGGGIAGVMAAAAAAKCGARTLLAESSTFLGGVVTMGPLEALMTPEDSNGTVIAGMAREFLDFLRTLDSGARAVEDTTGYCASIVPYDAETMKFALLKFLQHYDVTVLTEATLEEVERSGASISALRLRTKTGAVRVECGAVVDATGGGYASYLAGNDVAVGDESGRSQPVTVLCRIAGVDIDLLKEYVSAHSEEFKTFQKELNLQAEHLHLWGFTGALEAGHDSGALNLKRHEIHMMQTTRPGEVIANYSRINADPLDPFALSDAQCQGMEQVRELHDWFRRTIPAFADSYIVQTGYVGVRESGRVVGRYTLTRDDIVAARSGPTDVAMGAFPIDIHQSGDGMKFERIVSGYHIPQECLMARSAENLFLAGRCISATFEANASCRISMTCMSTGHAAGVMAAAYAAGTFTTEAVRGILKEQGAIL